MPKQMNTVYIGVGTNIGDKYQNIWRAYKHVQKSIGTITSKSSIYISPPWGFDANEDFYNSVIIIKSEFDPLEILFKLKKIEEEMGRKPKAGGNYESRIIDLDILDFNNKIFVHPDLHIPHQFIEERSFVAIPLKEINSNWVNARSGRSIKDICQKLNNEISKI
jgi:2-amino-4-hydroxy-6-hydroxymethyldihydropteridine diphosphokinase